MTTLQRRSYRGMKLAMGLTLLTNLPFLGGPFEPLRFLVKQHMGALYAAALSAFALLPIVLAIWVAANYLKTEPNEFVRTLVVRALLWAFGVTMAGDAVLGVLINLYPEASDLSVSLVNADLFFMSTILAFRLLRRGYQ